MTPHEKQLFAAAFFNDHALLRTLLETNSDTRIVVPIPRCYDYNNKEQYVISASEIAAMTRDCFFDIKDRDDPVQCFVHPGYEEAVPERHGSFIPSQVYQKSLETLEILKPYPGYCPEVDYHRLVCLINSYDPEDEDDAWFSKDEISKQVGKGFFEIDLWLVNAGVDRDKKWVIELLEAGANPYIEPEPEPFYHSDILHNLAGDDSFYFMNYSGYWNMNPLEVTNESLIYRMLWDLHGTASSAELFRVIYNFKLLPPQ